VTAAFTLVAIVGAVLVLVAAPSAPRFATLAAPPPDVPPTAVAIVAPAPPPLVSPDGRIVVAPGMLARSTNDSRVDAHAVGAALLIAGLAGAVASLGWVWSDPARRSRRRVHPPLD
jgi:hypothetical protein